MTIRLRLLAPLLLLPWLNVSAQVPTLRASLDTSSGDALRKLPITVLDAPPKAEPEELKAEPKAPPAPKDNTAKLEELSEAMDKLVELRREIEWKLHLAKIDALKNDESFVNSRRELMAKHKALVVKLDKLPEVRALLEDVDAAKDPLERRKQLLKLELLRLRLTENDPELKAARAELLDGYAKLTRKFAVNGAVGALVSEAETVGRQMNNVLDEARKLQAQP